MNPLILFKYFWIAFIVTTVANALIFKARIKPIIQEHPEKAPGYEKLIRGYLFWGNIPWVIMGAGILFGGVANVFSYFRPRDGNPFVLSFHFALYFLWVLGFIWLFFRRGAGFLADHPGMVKGVGNNPTLIRLFYGLSVVGGAIASFVMWTRDLQIPRFQ